MGRTLAELGETMSADEYALHLADDQISPWGPERMADLPAAIVATVFANAHKGKDAPAFKLADFMPLSHESEPDVEPDEQSIADFVRLVNQED